MRIAFIILAAVVFPGQAIAGASTPEALAREFYSYVLAQPGVGAGLPTAKEKERLTEFFPPALIRLLEAATVMEKKCVETAMPGDKPHIIEGNILVGNYEGATEVIVGGSRNEKKNVIVESRLFTVYSQFPKSHKHRVLTWVDQLVINRDGDRWVISNIKFGPETSLTGSLGGYLENGAKWCKAINTSCNQAAPMQRVTWLGVKRSLGEGYTSRITS